MRARAHRPCLQRLDCRLQRRRNRLVAAAQQLRHIANRLHGRPQAGAVAVARQAQPCNARQCARVLRLGGRAGLWWLLGGFSAKRLGSALKLSVLHSPCIAGPCRVGTGATAL